MVLSLGEPPGKFLLLFIHFYSSFWCCSSFIFVIHFVVVVFHFISRLLCHVTGTSPWLFRPAKTPTSSELYPDYFWLPLLFHPLQTLWFWVGVFCHRCFLLYAPSPTVLTQPAFIKAFLGAGSSFLKFAGLHTDPWNTDLVHLFDWFTVIHNFYIWKNSFLNSTIHYHELLVVKNLVYLFLTPFELFSLAKSHM